MGSACEYKIQIKKYKTFKILNCASGRGRDGIGCGYKIQITKYETFKIVNCASGREEEIGCVL